MLENYGMEFPFKRDTDQHRVLMQTLWCCNHLLEEKSVVLTSFLLKETSLLYIVVEILNNHGPEDKIFQTATWVSGVMLSQMDADVEAFNSFVSVIIGILETNAPSTVPESIELDMLWALNHISDKSVAHCQDLHQRGLILKWGKDHLDSVRHDSPMGLKRDFFAPALRAVGNVACSPDNRMAMALIDEGLLDIIQSAMNHATLDPGIKKEAIWILGNLIISVQQQEGNLDRVFDNERLVRKLMDMHSDRFPILKEVSFCLFRITKHGTQP